MDKLFESTAAAAPKDYARDLGQGLMESILQSVAEKAKRTAVDAVTGERGSTDSLDSLLAAAERMKALREVFGVAGGDAPTSGFWQAMGGMFQALSGQQQESMKLILQMQEKAEERTLALVNELRQEHKEAMARLKDERNPDSDILRQLGLQTIQGALQQPDPLERFISMRDKVLGALGIDPDKQKEDRVLSLEEWKAKKEIELRERELDAEARKEQARAEQLSHLIPAFAAAIGQGPRPEAAPPPAGAPPEAARGFYRYQCGACGTTFALDRPSDTPVCPACHTPLQVTGAAPAPEPAHGE